MSAKEISSPYKTMDPVGSFEAVSEKNDKTELRIIIDIVFEGASEKKTMCIEAK